MITPTRPSPPPPTASPPPGSPERPRTSSTCDGSGLVLLRNLIGVSAQQCPPLLVSNRPRAPRVLIPRHEHRLRLGGNRAVGGEHDLTEVDARAPDLLDRALHHD